MAIKKIIEIEAKVEQAQKEILELFQTMVQEEMKAENSVKSLRQQLREAQEDVATLSQKFGATSKEATDAARRASELKDEIGDAKTLVDAFNPDAKFNALSSSLVGVTSAFSAAQGVMGLMGIQSKNAEEALLRVQSAMALSTGLQGLAESKDSVIQLGAVIKNATIFQKAYGLATSIATSIQSAFGIAVSATSTSFNVLRAAIISTGIGALVVAIGFAVSAIIEWTDKNNKGLINQDALNKSIEDGEKIINKTTDAIKLSTNTRKNEAIVAGKTKKEIEQIEKDGNQAILIVLKQGVENQRKALKEADRLKIEDKTAFNAAIIKAEDELQKELDRQATEKSNKEVEDFNKQAADRQARNEKWKTSEEKRKLKQAELDRIKLQNKIDLDNEIVYGKSTELDRINKEEQEKIRKLISLGASEKQILDAQKYYDGLRQQVLIDSQNALEQIEIDAEDSRIEKEAKKRKEKIDADKKAAEEEIETAKIVAAAKNELQDQTIANIDNGIATLKTIFGKNKDIQKGLLIAESAIGIQKIVVSTQAANAADTATAALMGPAGIAYLVAKKIQNGVSAGIGIAANIAATAKALSALGGGGASSGGASGSLLGGSSAAPSFNVVGNAAVNQIAQTIGSQQPVQAYVVANQVTSQQSLDRSIVQNASFG